MRVVVGLAFVVGCYAPTAPENLPCGSNDACPLGQTCFAGFCRSDSLALDASGSSDASDGAIDSSIDTPGGPCAGGNNVCLVSCLATDPDCITTCGDGRCVGNAGEQCGTSIGGCNADCATPAVVCGNAQCQAGEAADCYPDCGPLPWTWSAEEQQLITLINNARTTGYACPGMPLVTSPAGIVDAALKAPAREWAWEMSHHEYIGNGEGCNGRTFQQRKVDGNFTGYIRSAGPASVQVAFDGWMADATICPLVMSASATRMNVGVALDRTTAFVVLAR